MGGENLMATPDICNAVVALIRRFVRGGNVLIRATAYQSLGSLLEKLPDRIDASDQSRTASSTFQEMRGDILKATRPSEHVDIQLALAQGLTSAARMRPNLFLCKEGLPIIDEGLKLAMSSSVKRPNVQKAFQIFLWVTLGMGGMAREHDDNRSSMKERDAMAEAGQNRGQESKSSGLERYIKLAEGKNGMIMTKFVAQTQAKIEDFDVQGCSC